MFSGVVVLFVFSLERFGDGFGYAVIFNVFWVRSFRCFWRNSSGLFF